MKAVVIGGGIGGLAAAVALRRADIGVGVYERAGEPAEIGAGLGLYPNAMKALRRLGLRDRVLNVGRPLRPSGQIRSSSGDVLLEVPSAAMEDRFGDVALGVHRQALHKVLLEAVRESGGEIYLGTEFTDFELSKDGVVVYFADGSEEPADLLIGADGLRSKVREILLSDGPPLYAGYSAWRGLVESAEKFLGENAGFEVWGSGSRFGFVALGNGGAYWFATKNAPNPRSLRSIDSSVSVDHKAELLSRFRDWQEPIPSAIAATKDTDLHFDGIYYREPAKSWGRGRSTLLGDAAHPMTPDLGQGACQAIEDAVALGESLETMRDPVPALRLYEERRMERTAYVVRQSLRVGRLSQSQNPLLQAIRTAAFKILPQRTMTQFQLKQMERIMT